MVRTNCLHPKIRKQTAEETQEEHGFPSESVGGSTPHNGEEGTYRAGGLSGGESLGRRDSYWGFGQAYLSTQL